MNVSFELKDFFPYYPSSSFDSEYDPIYKDIYYNIIPRKKEFDECRAPMFDKITNDGTPWPHQNFMARYMSPNTPYNNLLVFHGMGTGKCVHPETIICTTKGRYTIESLWNREDENMIYTVDNLNEEWKDTDMEVYTVINSLSKKPIVGKVKRLYREYVDTIINSITVKCNINNTIQTITLKCTQRHQLFVMNKGFTNFVYYGDKVLFNLENNEIITSEVVNVETIQYKGYVYDLEVEHTHNYFANGILTHNTCLMAAVSEYAKSILPSLNKTIILVKNDTLKKNVIDDIATKCTKDKYNITLDPKTGKPLSSDSRFIRISGAISKQYSIMTYYDFAKTIKSVNSSMYDNSFIIIDEAHNLRNKKMANKFGVNSYKLIHQLLHSIKGSKVLLLTGTPMRNNSSEIVHLMNLILPLDKQMTEDNWNQTFFTTNDNNQVVVSEEGKEKLKEYFYSRISYLRSPVGNVNIQYMGEIRNPLQYTKCYYCEMDPFQSDKYTVYYNKDKQKEPALDDEEEEDIDDEDADSKKSLWISSRQASSFIFPNGECGIIAEKKYLDIDYGGDTSKTRIHDYNCSKQFIQYLQLHGTDQDSMLKQLKKCSIKFWFTLHQILKNPKKKTFIYSSFVLGGGIVLLSALLKLFGFSSATTKGFGTESYPKERRFLLLSSKTMNPEQMRVGVREIFNSRENVDGDYIQVILGSRIIGEGISFFHTRQMFLITPSWNNATTEQIIARVVRADSHPEWMEDRNLEIYRLDAQPLQQIKKEKPEQQEVKSVDTIMYLTSEIKDVRIKQIERIMKTVAIDCSLNRERNININDQPNSIQCDYMSNCNYQCEYVDPMYYSPEWSLQNPELVITDTFYNYFAFRQIINITDKIKDLFTLRQAYDFEEMYEILKNDSSISSYLSGIVLSRTLHTIIGSNLKIKNHLGFNNYLREDSNLYFLVDDAASSTNYTSAYYAANPLYDTSYSLAQYNMVINDYYNEESTVNRLYKLLIEHIDNPEMIKTILLNCDPSVSTDWIENAYDKFYSLSREELEKISNKQSTELSKYIFKLFKNVFRILVINDVETSVNFFNKNNIRIKSQDGNWVNATKEQTNEIIEKRMEQIANIKAKFGYYAIIDEKDIFRIKEVAPVQFTKQGEIDSRISRELGALKCGTGKLAKGGLIYRVFLISLRAMEHNIPPLLEDLHTPPALNTSSKDYKENLKPYVIRYMEEKAINKQLLKLSLKKRKELLLELLKTYPVKSEDFQLLTRSIKQAKEDTDEEVYLNNENIKAIVRDLNDIEFLMNHFKIKLPMTDIEFIDSLPEETKNTLSKVLKYKANTICESLKLWFQENSLTI